MSSNYAVNKEISVYNDLNAVNTFLRERANQIIGEKCLPILRDYNLKLSKSFNPQYITRVFAIVPPKGGAFYYFVTYRAEDGSLVYDNFAFERSLKKIDQLVKNINEDLDKIIY